MFRVSPHEFTALQRAGGEKFTAFVDDLIRAQAFACGVPDANIHTNRKTNEPDGGVDTQVTAPFLGDRTGRFDRPTIWQYKASTGSKVAPRSEIKTRSYAAKLIKEDYTYRLCICDQLSSRRVAALMRSFTNRIRIINPDAPDPQILTTDDLAAWAERFPAIVLRHFRGGRSGAFAALDLWRAMVTSLTPEFVATQPGEAVAAAIQEYADLAKTVPDPIFTLYGDPGVGKTRLVYQALTDLPGASGLVVYTEGREEAIRIAYDVAQDRSLHAILVADECSSDARRLLAEVAGGASGRLRVIAIGDTGDGPDSAQPDNFLRKPAPEAVQDVLARNFPRVPADLRRGYADLCEGLIGPAAELCRSWRRTGLRDSIGRALVMAEDCLDRGVPSDDDQRVIEAISLLTRVGYKDEVKHELTTLCKITGLDHNEFRQRASHLHQTTGFVGQAGRYYYVTPKIVAQAAFCRAWRRWGVADPERFLDEIPPEIAKQFQDRVARSAPDKVRECISRLFADWAASVQPEHLADPAVTQRLIVLVETDPQSHLPRLRALVERSIDQELFGVVGDSISGQWGPRRHLVWLAERLAAFAEYFEDAEAVLLRLAVTESEHRISNNATAIWKQLFRIFLSGTEAPFANRLELLRTRLSSADGRVSALALDALEGVLEPHPWSVVGPFVVAGRVRPDEWRPQTHLEYAECFRATADLLRQAAGSDRADVSLRARKLAMTRLWQLLDGGQLAAAQDILTPSGLSEEMRAQLLPEVDNYLELRTEPADDRHRLPEDYLQQIRSWLASLRPQDFHGRLVTAVAVNPWLYTRDRREEEWRSELRALAAECIRDPGLLDREMTWLCSPDARSAAYFGDHLSGADTDDALLDAIFGSVLQHQSALLARGYVAGTLRSRMDRLTRVNEWIDRIGLKSPELAFDLFMVGGDETGALERALRLVDAERLPTTHLGGFTYGGAARHLSVDQVVELLRRLLPAVERGDPRADRVAVEFVGNRLYLEKAEGLDPILRHTEARQLAWRLVDATATDAGDESHSWSKLLEALSADDPARAVRTAAVGLTGDGLHQKGYCEELLMALARERPAAVMEQLGEVMLEDSERGMHFHVAVHRSLIAALPTEVVIGWVRKHGVDAARRLARHLPLPGTGPDGKPVVPRLTEFVLSEFGQDEWTFDEFCAGTHSLQMYGGDIAAQHEAEAQLAERFLQHPIERVRQWAQREVRSARWHAEDARRRKEEWEMQ
jgi:hypothetical protein